MQIGFVVYDGMTALDFIGIHDPVTRLKTMGFTDDIKWEICGLQESVTATGDVTIDATETGSALSDFDVVIVPGCVDVAGVAENEDLIDWLRPAAAADLKVSVCTGAVLLGAAGLLGGHRATTHPMAFDALSEYCEVVEDRVVDDGDVITARGVTAAIDLGLYLCETFADKQTREAIATQMDYPYYERSGKLTSPDAVSSAED